MTTERHFRAEGRVQAVMFRQTLIRAAQKRCLRAAASNMPDGSVTFLLDGDPDKIEEIAAGLTSGREINSWGAHVTRLSPLPENDRIPFGKHQVTTENVDSFRWNTNIDMFL